LRSLGLTSPIIALSANAVAGARELFLASGMNGFIAKPINPEELNKVLAEFLPKDKIDFPGSGQAEPERRESNKPANADAQEIPLPKLETLRKISFLDIDAGLERNNRKESFYLRIMRSAALSLPEEFKSVEGFYQTEDWKNFAIKAHALKGAFAQIGALRLSEDCRLLEFAAKEGRFQDCKAAFSGFLERAKTFESALKEAFNLKTEK
jgi:HPt (histidine-containing phosphotransfer) domain-containing protein